MLREFLARVENFLSHHPGVKPARLGEEAVGDPSFVGDLRRGRKPSLETAERLLRWIEKYEAGRITLTGQKRGRPPGRASVARKAASHARSGAKR